MIQYEFWEIDPSHKGTLLDPTLITDAEKGRWLDLVVSTLDVLPHLDWRTMCPPIAHGLYFQYEDGKEIYIGRSIGKRPSKTNSVASRLYTHRDKCEGRWGLYPERMTYKVIPINTNARGHIAMLEEYAIEHYSPKLNGTGYGSMPPGEGRSGQGLSEFEKQHPPLGTPEAEAKQREFDSSLAGIID